MLSFGYLGCLPIAVVVLVVTDFDALCFFG